MGEKKNKKITKGYTQRQAHDMTLYFRIFPLGKDFDP